jgi:hypothetical protein
MNYLIITLKYIWANRTMTAAAIQIVLSEVARSGLVNPKAQSWCLLGTGILTGLIALHNKIREIRAERAQP